MLGERDANHALRSFDQLGAGLKIGVVMEDLSYTATWVGCGYTSTVLCTRSKRRVAQPK